MASYQCNFLRTLHGVRAINDERREIISGK